ncbi:MAG: beta-ketoacyl-ACP synthase III, partial [Syntrophomonadaceae bacterium]|nr:beta-ketoacyl-ACP synthase III [Syntrophomonadaceae bacterium]
MRVQILGTGSYLPERVLTNADLEKMVDTTDEWIFSRSGIRERRIAGPEMATSDMALPAARAALEQAGVAATDLDLIVVGTVTPDMPFPSTACILQDRLGAVNAAAFDLSAGCTGFLYGLAVAERFLRGPECRYALVVGAEMPSRILDFTDRTTCVLFGDGAGAAVLGRGGGANGILATYMAADGSGAMYLYQPAGGTRLPASTETVAQRLHSVRMLGNDVFKFAVKTVPECAERVLAQAGMTVDQVDHVALHQANIRILQAAVKRLGVPWEKVLTNIERYGNIS